MTMLENVMKSNKQIAEKDSSREEIIECAKKDGLQMALEYFCKNAAIKFYNAKHKMWKKVKETNIFIFMQNGSLSFGDYELFSSAEVVDIIIDKQKLYIFIENKEAIKVYTISGRYAVWIDMFTDADRECIMFEPENEQDICLFDILQENYARPKAGGCILSKMENRLKRKYESK